MNGLIFWNNHILPFTLLVHSDPTDPSSTNILLTHFIYNLTQNIPTTDVVTPGLTDIHEYFPVSPLVLYMKDFYDARNIHDIIGVADEVRKHDKRWHLVFVCSMNSSGSLLDSTLTVEPPLLQHSF